MEDLIISMEATCDLPKELIEKYNFKIINMNYNVGGVCYSTENDTVISTKLYERMRAGERTSTSQINQISYSRFFRELARENKPILHIGFSSGQSGTFYVAKKIADEINEEIGNKIYVVDSLCSCSGQGMLGILAMEYSKNAKNIEELIDYLERTRGLLNHIFSVDNLKYLANGGRISSSSAFIGNILNIKPVMRVDENGALAVTQKVISRKKALMTIFNKAKENYDKNYDICFVSHADCLEDAEFLKSKIEAETTLKPVITNLGPVIGCHSGPGTIAVYYIGTSRKI